MVTQIEISDPVAHRLYICVPKDRVCQLEAFSAPRFVPPPPIGSANFVSGPRSIIREDLGSQAVDGVQALGTRQTTVIETGALGNNTPMTIRREFWFSPQLGVNLISKLQDPRFGDQTFEVSNILLGDPDANLFQPPQNSRIIDLRKEESASSPR